MDFILPDEPLLTTKDVAKMCNVSADIVRYWRSKGRGPSYYKLGCCRYRREDVERWLERNKIKTKDNVAAA